jgi:PadR family transcriptional regulator, regulatory protein AphA
MSPRQTSAFKLEHVLLALLDQKPVHGYELFQELNEMKGIARVWNIKLSMLYVMLDKLVEKGYLSSRLVQGESYPPRKYFYVTEDGKNSLQEWIRTPVHRARNIRQEFLAKLVVARRYGNSEVLELIRIQEQECQTWLAELQANVVSMDQEHMDEWFVFSFRINRVEGELKWLKECQKQCEIETK